MTFGDEESRTTAGPKRPPVLRGSRALEELLARRLFDVREVEPDRFPQWLERHLSGWRQDPLFLQRSKIRDLRLANPELQILEEARSRARVEYESSDSHAAIEATRQELAGVENAVAGLTHALGRATEPSERDRLRTKRETFVERMELLREQVRGLKNASPEALAVDRISAELEDLRERVGFNREVARLADLQRKRGRSSGRSGVAFEKSAREVIEAEVVPELAAGVDGAEIVLLHGVTLAAAKTEIDQLLVRPGSAPDAPVEVLGLVEAKRNPNDLARGLSKRLENLSWLAGHEAGYDAEVYTTRTYRSGHFEGVATHAQQGASYRFTADSFRHFLRDLHTGDLPGRLYLVSRPEPLWGLESGAMARIAHRVSTDLDWNPADREYMADLLGWCQSLAGEMETPDLLERYAADREASTRVLLVDV